MEFSMWHAPPPLDIEPLPNRQGGFTLIEVVIAMTIFAIGLLAANMMQSASIKGNRSAFALSQSSNWAAGKMEEILSWPYDDPKLLDDLIANPQKGTIPNSITPTAIIPTPDGYATSPDGGYTMIWYVTQDSPIVNTKTIDFTVIWGVRGILKAAPFSCTLSQTF